MSTKAQLRDDLVPLLSPMDWVMRAACREREPELFDEFPRAPDLYDFGRLAQALGVCAHCPVRRECLEFGVAHKISGVHGGRMLVAGHPLGGSSLQRRFRAAERRATEHRQRRRAA